MWLGSVSLCYFIYAYIDYINLSFIILKVILQYDEVVTAKEGKSL
jgi:hypothetical protein